MITKLPRKKFLNRFGLVGLVIAVISTSSYGLDPANEPIQALTVQAAADVRKVALGKKLFHDTRLSKSNTVSCASCHNLKTAGVDRKRFSTGFNGALGKRNAPTVFNSGFNFKQFWDGRANNLVELSGMPITDPIEMGNDWPRVIKAVSADPSYSAEFKATYGTIDKNTISEAIAEFQKTLVTIDSPFDRFLSGEQDAITDIQKRGYELFKNYGCSGCHQGKNVGGNMFQKFGVLKDINLRKSDTDDLGRYNVTNNEWDKHVFKVPSLRLAVRTPPYFHDGSVATIEEAVDIMIEFQLGRSVPEQDRKAIIEFLESLVGQYQGEPL